MLPTCAKCHLVPGGWAKKLVFDSQLGRGASAYSLRRHMRPVAAVLWLAAGFAVSPADGQVMKTATDGTVPARQGWGAAPWEVVTSPASDQTVDQDGQPIVPAYAYTAVGPA